MREILFRGKSVCDNGRWLYGALHNDTHEIQIQPNFDEPMNTTRNRLADLVIPSSVGQYVGLIDVNGVKVFEGDLVNAGDHFGIGYVYFCVRTVQMMIEFEGVSMPVSYPAKLEVTGNIHDK
jgi:hypothetical protein